MIGIALDLPSQLLRQASAKFPLDSRIEPKLVEDLGREMVAKCGHLPLAISVIGGILREKNCLDGWKKVHKVIDSYLRRSESSERYQAIEQKA